MTNQQKKQGATLVKVVKMAMYEEDLLRLYREFVLNKCPHPDIQLVQISIRARPHFIVCEDNDYCKKCDVKIEPELNPVRDGLALRKVMKDFSINVNWSLDYVIVWVQPTDVHSGGSIRMVHEYYEMEQAIILIAAFRAAQLNGKIDDFPRKYKDKISAIVDLIFVGDMLPCGIES